MSAEQDETLPCEDAKETTKEEEEDAESLTVPRDNQVRGTDHYADAFEPPSQEAGRAMAGEGKSVLSEDLSNKLTDEQKKAIGERWLGNFERLREYGIENGHFDIPQMDKEGGNEKFKGLGGWINKQRNEKKRHDKDGSGSMTGLRVRLLESIGFPWGKNKGEASWNERYNELVNYKKQHGHCKVPTKGDIQGNYKALGRWVTEQRAKRKKLPEDKVKKLEDVGFLWYAFD